MKKASIGVINKALDILDTMLSHDGDIGISELANLTGLNVSTVDRITSNLVNRGYLRQQGKRGKYRLGLKFLEFSSAVNETLEIRKLALPFIQKLCNISDESINLAILESDYAVYIEHIESSQVLRTFAKVGNKVPLYCTGIGKVFLANMSEEKKSSYLTNEILYKYTDNTITDINELKNQLFIIQQEGVAIDNGEYDIGTICVASPVKNWAGEVVASISVSGPETRLNIERVEELKKLTKDYGLEISRVAGYKGS